MSKRYIQTVTLPLYAVAVAMQNRETDPSKIGVASREQVVIDLELHDEVHIDYLVKQSYPIRENQDE